MGIYFLAAGKASRNRQKTLDRGHAPAQILAHLDNSEAAKVGGLLAGHSVVYAWGANEGVTSQQLASVAPGEYVVDVANEAVEFVFRFLGGINPRSDSLQHFFGWDAELPREKRRAYSHVFFLADRVRPRHRKKAYYTRAFGMVKPYWLLGQKYISDEKVRQAMARTGSATIEGFLGIEAERPKDRLRETSNERWGDF